MPAPRQPTTGENTLVRKLKKIKHLFQNPKPVVEPATKLATVSAVRSDCHDQASAETNSAPSTLAHADSQQALALGQRTGMVSTPEPHGASLASIETPSIAATAGAAQQVDRASEQIVPLPGNAQTGSTASTHTSSLQTAPVGINPAQRSPPPGHAKPENATPLPISARPTADKLLAQGAPKWNMALDTFRKDNKNRYNEIEEKVKEVAQRGEAFQGLIIPKSIAENPQSHEAVLRVKRWLPSVAAVKGVVMPIAALDPHKIAPIVCAAVFGITEVSGVFGNKA
jgi:hypothetical protein